jgi:hypothetical protein
MGDELLEVIELTLREAVLSKFFHATPDDPESLREALDVGLEADPEDSPIES